MGTISTRYNQSFDLLTRAKTHPLPNAPTEAKGGEAVDVKAKIAEARKAAEGLVATSFIKPILSQVRESNNAPPPFGPTSAEKQFGSLLDNELADEIARASQFPIVDRLVKQFTQHLPQQEPTTSVDLNA